MTGGASGGQDSSDTFIFNRNYDQWRYVGAMPTSRYGLSCGTSTDLATGEAVVVVAGGYNIANGGGHLATVEIFSLEGETWSTGVNPLPAPLQDATSVQVRKILTFRKWSQFPVKS